MKLRAVTAVVEERSCVHASRREAFYLRGSVLVAVLWCVAVLSVVVVGALYSSRLGLGAAKNFEDKVQAHYLALAGIEKAKALLYHDALARKKSGKNHSGELYSSTDALRDVPLGRGKFRIIRQGAREESDQLIYGIRDEESRFNINTATLQELTKLDDMRPEIAASIIDWRDKDDSPTPNGAERDYYASLRPPYIPRNGEIQTIREMLLIKGVTPELLLGEDANANGLLDPEENDGDENPPHDNHNNSLEAGWSGIFCVDSAVANRNAAGDPRVNVQTASESELSAVKGITPEIAKAIVAYRGRQKLENIADLMEVANLAPDRGRGNQPGQPQSQAQSDVSQAQQQNARAQGPVQTVGPKLISQELFEDICDDVTVENGSTLKGVVNINTASIAVLSLLNGVNEQLARNIVNHRQSAGYFANIAGLLKVDGMTRDIFKQIAPRITARSETFRILSEGRVTSTGARERIEVVVRLSGKYIDTIAYRENL
jgi:competence ComEA-like helix-hairpin-helix protein